MQGGHGAGIGRLGMRIGLAQPLLSPPSRSLPSVRAWIGPLRVSRRDQQLERTEVSESELSHVAAANLAGVQGIGDWGHASDGGVLSTTC